MYIVKLIFLEIPRNILNSWLIIYKKNQKREEFEIWF